MDARGRLWLPLSECLGGSSSAVDEDQMVRGPRAASPGTLRRCEQRKLLAGGGKAGAACTQPCVLLTRHVTWAMWPLSEPLAILGTSTLVFAGKPHPSSLLRLPTGAVE